VTPVKGDRKLVPAEPRNPCEFARTVGLGAACSNDKAADSAGARTIEGGAAHE